MPSHLHRCCLSKLLNLAAMLGIFAHVLFKFFSALAVLSMRYHIAMFQLSATRISRVVCSTVGSWRDCTLKIIFNGVLTEYLLAVWVLGNGVVFCTMHATCMLHLDCFDFLAALVWVAKGIWVIPVETHKFCSLCITLYVFLIKWDGLKIGNSRNKRLLAFNKMR